MRRNAFTLIELLVVIGILALLVGMLLPSVQKVRASAAMLQCKNNLKQINLACLNYESVNGTLPPCVAPNDHPLRSLHMHVLLLPYLEQQAIYEQALRDCTTMPITHLAPPHKGLRTLVKAYQCPADDRQAFLHRNIRGDVVALTGYLGVSGTHENQPSNGIYGYGLATKMTDIVDGTSNTIGWGERPPTPDYLGSWWYSSFAALISAPVLNVSAMRGIPEGSTIGAYYSCPPGPYDFKQGDLNNRCDGYHFWSTHTGGAHFGIADGSVRFLKYSANSILPALATRNGGEAVGLPD